MVSYLSEYMDKIFRLAAEFGIALPLPEEMSAIEREGQGND